MDLDRFFRRKDRDGFDTTPVVYIQGYDELKDTTPQEAETSDNKGFLDKAENTAIWGLKHLWNGAKAIPRNFGEFVTMLAQPRAQGIMNDPEMREVAKYAPDAPDTLQNAVRQAREDLMNNEYLKPTKVEDNTLLAKFGGALLENGPQYLLMAPLGPYAGSIAMGGLAAGSTYESARQEQHMTDDQAIKAGLTDAPFEMALEHLGMKGTVLKSLGKGIGRATKSTRFADLGAKLNARLGKAGGWLEPGDPLQKRNVLRAAVEGFASEAPTEFAQQYAQQLSTDVYDPKVSKAQMLYNVTTNPKTFNDALFAGAVGGVMGGGMGAVLTPLHNRAIDKITAKTGTSYNSSVDNVLAQSKAGQEQAKIYDDVMAKREAQKKLEQRAEIQKAEAAEQEQRAQVAQQTQNAMPLGYEEFSDEIKQAINDNATKDVPPALIAAIIQQESGGNKTVVSPAGAQGLMQLMPGTAEEMKVANPFDVDDNVRGGVAYYTKLKKMFGGNDVVALAAYNAGDGYVQKWIKNGIWDGTLEHADQIPFAQTRDYVKNVMSNWQGSISNGVYVNAGATPAEQMALIQSQNERDAAIREAYNQVANSQMAKDFALDLARTSTDPKVVNEVNRAVKLKDDKKLEEIARANGYVDEDLTPMPKKDTGNVFTTHNQAGAAQGNINTNDRVNISSMEENGGRPPIIAVDRKSMAAPTEMTVNDEANIVSDRIARALVGDTKNGNIAPISKQNVNNDTFIIKNGNGANSAVDTNISATVNTQPTGATVSGIQDVTNTLNSGDLPTAEQSAAAINELQDAPQSQERDDLISALAKNINGESVAAPSQERTNQAVRTVAEPTVEPTATKEEALFTPTAQPRADAQDRLNEAVQKLQRRELPTKEESQAILADLAHLPDSDGVRQSRAIFEGIVRRDFSMFGKNNQAQMEALAAKEDAERRAAQESAASKTSISLVDGAVSSNKALSNEESRGDVKTAVNKENVNRRINELLNTLKTGTIPTNEEMESVLRDVDTLTNTIPGYGNGIEAKMARVVFPRVMKGDFSIYRGATRKKLQESARAKQAEIERQNTGSNGKNPFAANVAVSVYDSFNQSQHPNVHQDNSLVGIQKKTHALVTDINEGGLYGKDVKENAKNKSLSKSARIGLASNRLTVMGVFKPNDNGGDFVFQFKHSSKKVGEIKFSLRDFCEYAEAGGNAHVPIGRNMETVFYNSNFFKTHFETPGKNTDKSYVRYKDNNHEDPPRAGFFVDRMNSVFKDLITAYDNRYYKGETLAEDTKVVDNKEKKNTEIDKREGMNLDDGEVSKLERNAGEVGKRMEANDAGTTAEMERKRNMDGRLLSKTTGETEENSTDGGREEAHSVDGFRGGRELSDRKGQETDSGVDGQYIVTKSGEAFVSYARLLRDNAKVLVGIYRTKALQRVGKDTGSSSITKEEFTKAQKQMRAQDRILRKWVDANGDAKIHNENNTHRIGLEKRLIGGYYKTHGPYNRDKQAYLILGLPAAGKSSLADPLAKQKRALIVDSDEFKKRLPEFENGAGANYVHEESSDMAEALMNRALKDGTNIVYPIVGKTPKTLQEKIDKLKAAGYDIHLAYVDLPMKKAVERATNRYILEGRLVGLAYIESIGDRPLINFNAVKHQEGITDYALYDNDVAFGEEPRLVEGTDYLHNVPKEGQGNIDKEESKENNEDNNAVINSTTKGADENDTGRPERSSGSRGIQGEERTAGTQEKGKDDTGAGRGVDSKHVGDVEQASVLRSGENQNDNEVRQSHSDDMERGKGTGEDKVQPHRSGSDVRLRERRSDDGQSTRNAVKGRDDTTGTDSGHENGSTESVGRTSGDEGGTGKKQTGESSESVNKEKADKEKVDKEETEMTKEKNNERPKPEAIRRGRFYSNKTERENVTALLSKPSERVNANKEALNVYLRVTNDGAITDMGSISLKPKDLKALSMFTGWGGLKTQLQDMKIGDNSWLKEHFSDEEITTMMNSTTTGYFTPPAVIDFMWKAVVKMNVQQDARILEPSMGIGNFVMQLPKEYKDAAHITGIELDKITGNMSQLLYGADGKTNIRVQGYEQNRIGDNSFDLVIGNVPFSSNSFKTGEKRFDVYKPLLHDFFFLKAVKQTRPGGLIAFITTSGTMDKVDSKIRKAVAQEATLIAAYRLPNNTFAGTGVVADIIFLQKNDGGKNTNGVDADEWMRSEKVEEVNGSGVDSYMNTYFMKHPENVLGKLDSTYDWRSGKNKITVSPKEGVSLEAELSKGIRKLPKDIVAQRTEAISGDTAITTITSDIKIGKIFVGKDGKFYRSVAEDVKPDNANEHETRYQGTTIQSETKAYTLSDVKTSFKGQDVKQVGKNGFEVTLKNGNKVTITQTGEITRSDGKKIRGKYIKGNITLTNLANAFTLDHEIFHFAKDCLYTQKEWAFIEKKARALLAREGNKNPTADEIEDRAADWYADWKYKRAHPSGVMQKLFHMVYDFVSRVTDLVHKNVNTRFSNLANGDLFERQMTDNHGNTMKYSTVEETNDAVEKTTKDIAEDTEHGFNMFTKAVSALKNFNKKDGRYNNITVEMNTNSFNWIKYGVMNPDHLAKNNETLKVFTDLGKNSMRELQHLRNDTEEKLNKIAKAIEGKDKNGNVRRELYDRIMEEGELNGEEYTREELVVEGIDKGVIDAYLETRKMYNDFYKMVDATKRGVETFHKTVNINGVEALRADTFVENLDVKPLANGRYEVTFGMAKKYPHLGEKVAGSDLKELLSSNYAKVNDIRDKDGVAVKIESTDDIKDDETYSVDYVTIPKPLSNIKGYFHHFFENWMVYEKVTDESGAVSYVPVGSYRSRREALQAFKKLDDLLHEDKKYTREELEAKGIDRNVIDTYMSTMMDNPALGAHEYVIRPKEFHMPMNGGVALGDVKFEQAMRAIEAKYEVNEDEARKLAKGILKKKVGHRFLGATMHRTGQKGYSTDMLHVLHMYTTKATRYIALERFKNKAYRAFERFFGVPVDESKKGGLQQYIKKYIEDVNGNPTRIEEMFNELINNLTGGKLAKWFGTDRPFMSWSNTVMAYSAALKLGLFNISSAAINLTQLTNAVTLLGIKPFLKAHWITGRFTDEERKFLKDVGVETQLGLDAGAGYDKNRMTSIQNKLISYSLFTFTWSEQKVRQITALMAFAEAKRRGMSYEEAVEFAQSANDDANFDYGVNNAPLFIRAGGPVTQMMFQFMKFPVNQIAFMTDIIRHGTNAQRARLMIPLTCAGVYGVPFWAAVICPALAAAVAGAAGDDYDDPELYLKKKCYEWAGDDPFWQGFLDVAFYGLPAKFGVNIGRRMGVGDFGGDVSKSLRGGKYGYDLGDLSSSLLGGVMFSSIKQAMTQWGNGNVIEAIKAFSPALGNAAQAVVGERRTTRGRVATRYDDISTRIIKALGFMPIEETKEGEKERILKEERRIKIRGEQRIIDDFIRAKEDGDKKRMHDLIETMRKKGIKPKRVADEIKRKNQTGLERAEDFGKKKQDKKPNTRKRYDGRLKHYSLKRSHEKGNSYDSLYNM